MGSRKGYGSADRKLVRTTIVGGRPPQSEQIPRHIPRGLEVLIKKAAVDPAFKNILFVQRAEAAAAIGLKLTAAEEAMLAAVPLPQLEGIVAHTRISPKLKPAFLGYAAGVMLAALGTTTSACDDNPTAPPVDGIRPDPPPGVTDRARDAVKQPEKGDESVTRGIRPARP
jgi:hypothetical protein